MHALRKEDARVNVVYKVYGVVQTSMEVGAVCDLEHVKEAVLTARLIMRHTSHSILAGLSAANFAIEMGLAAANLTTEASSKLHADW